MKPLSLEVRTPSGVVVDRPVRRITAEDETGWFGIRPGRTDLMAVLPPGLLVFEDDEGESFVAVSGGLLGLKDGHCTVLVTQASEARDLTEIGEDVARQRRRREERAEVHQGVVRDLAREALRRLLEGR